MLERLYRWYGKRVVRLVAVALAILLIVVMTKDGETEDQVVATQTLPVVTTASPASLSGARTLELVGTVSAKTQAKLLAEASGRVISVPVTLGANVNAGTILAQLENASERAAVLQAEGVYEAALAAARQSTVSVSSAETAVRAEENKAITTHASAYNTVSSIVRSDLDEFFSNPEGAIIGLKVKGFGNTETLIEARRKLQTSLPAWQSRTVRSNATTIDADLSNALLVTREVTAMVDLFLTIFSYQDSDLPAETVRSYTSRFITLRSNLITTEASLNSAETNLASAQDALLRAEAAGRGETAVVSAADAQVKQALGALRAAEANLAKTIIRTPISGTVNVLPIRVGDFVGQNTLVAEVANTSGFEVTTFVTEAEAANLTIGDEVIVKDNTAGTITNISPVIDNSTGKIEVRIGVADTTLRSGDTVTIALRGNNASTDARILIPLTAVKLSTDAAAVFIVNADNVLEAKTVTLGPVIQDSILITAGLNADTEIVLDVRGRSVGEEVTVATR